MKFLPRPSLFFLALVASVLCADAAGAWRFDPLGWREDGTAFESRGSGLALAEAAPSGTLEFRARVAPRSCGEDSYGTVGIAAYASSHDFWCLSLVKGPDHSGARHFCELGPRSGDLWPAYSFFRRIEEKKGVPWEWGRTYDLSLRFSADKVEGEILDAETGALVFRTAFAPGERPLLPSGVIPALRVTGRFKARVEPEMAGIATPAPPGRGDCGPASFPPYAPVGPETGIRGTATGFFHIERIDGVDWAVDPVGRAVPITGIDHVKWEGFACEKLGGRRAYREHNEKAYPSHEAWADETLSRLRAWGFDMLAAGCELSSLGHRGMAHAIGLSLNDSFCHADEEWWIAKNLHAPCTGFPNVFHPDYGRACEWAAETRCASSRDDPWLVGWFIDNELAWWGRSPDRATGLFDLVAKLPDNHSAKQALLEYLGSTALDGNRQQSAIASATREQKLGFLRLIAERYFAANTAAIRKADPNHMILGCRFAGLNGAHDVVWEIAGKYCDVVSFNCYPWADIDRGVVLTDKGGVPIVEEFRRHHGLCGKPMIVTEWSFPALDTGRPCYHGAGQRFRTQAERTAATELFARTMLGEPYFVGYDYFMWLDQPALGISHWFPEDSNYGLVQENGEPHKLITEMFAKLHAGVVELRGNVHKSANATIVHKSQIPIASEHDHFFENAGRGEKQTHGDLDSSFVDNDGQLSFVNNPVGFHQATDGSWSLSNGLVRLSGRVGGLFMADEIAWGEAAPVGRFRALLQWNNVGKTLWTDTERVTDVAFERDEATGIVTATFRAEGFAADTGAKNPDGAAETHQSPSFAIAARLSLAPGQAAILAEIVSVENLGNAPLRVERVFMRPFAIEAKPKQTDSVPKLWKGPLEGWWQLSDGSRFGLTSRDDALASLSLWIKEDGIQHPDARFGSSFEIAPGATWRPSLPMGALLRYDTNTPH